LTHGPRASPNPLLNKSSCYWLPWVDLRLDQLGSTFGDLTFDRTDFTQPLNWADLG